MKVWDVSCGTFRTQGPLTLSKGHEGCISSCVFSDDGKVSVDTNIHHFYLSKYANRSYLTFALPLNYLNTPQIL